MPVRLVDLSQPEHFHTFKAFEQGRTIAKSGARWLRWLKLLLILGFVVTFTLFKIAFDS